MGQPMYLSLLAITVCLITLLATCPTLAVGWPVDSSFYDEIKRVVYGGGENIDDSVAATESSPPPPLSLPLSSQASIYNILDANSIITLNNETYYKCVR